MICVLWYGGFRLAQQGVSSSLLPHSDGDLLQALLLEGPCTEIFGSDFFLPSGSHRGRLSNLRYLFLIFLVFLCRCGGGERADEFVPRNAGGRMWL